MRGGCAYKRSSVALKAEFTLPPERCLCRAYPLRIHAILGTLDLIVEEARFRPSVLLVESDSHMSATSKLRFAMQEPAVPTAAKHVKQRARTADPAGAQTARTSAPAQHSNVSPGGYARSGSAPKVRLQEGPRGAPMVCSSHGAGARHRGSLRARGQGLFSCEWRRFTAFPGNLRTSSTLGSMPGASSSFQAALSSCEPMPHDCNPEHCCHDRPRSNAAGSTAAM